MYPLQRVAELLNEEEEDYREARLPTLIKEGTIEFRNVSFGYTEERPVLDGFNLRVEEEAPWALPEGAEPGKQR